MCLDPGSPMHACRLIAMAGTAAVLLAGCPFPIPTGYSFNSRENLGEAVPAFIKSGETTRLDVMMELGEPDAMVSAPVRIWSEIADQKAVSGKSWRASLKMEPRRQCASLPDGQSGASMPW